MLCNDLTYGVCIDPVAMLAQQIVNVRSSQAMSCPADCMTTGGVMTGIIMTLLVARISRDHADSDCSQH